MISVEKVKECLLSLTQLDTETLDEKEIVIENALGYIQSIVRDYTEADEPRVVMLAAARANYLIALLNSSENGVSSFKAGDVSFTKESGSYTESAKAFYESTLGENNDLIRQNGFIFEAV